ncbi:unnamed protein product, partial [Meganyctiphanes norvegica]
MQTCQTVISTMNLNTATMDLHNIAIKHEMDTTGYVDEFTRYKVEAFPISFGNQEGNHIDSEESIKLGEDISDNEFDLNSDIKIERNSTDSEPCLSTSLTRITDNIPSNYKGVSRDHFHCQHCDYSTLNKMKFKRHLRTHKEKKHQCSHCNQRFLYKSYMLNHQTKHIGDKPFQCTHCNKCFARKSDIVKHEKLHMEEKLYQCRYCGKRFAVKGVLVHHERIHTGEKPYQCSFC